MRAGLWAALLVLLLAAVLFIELFIGLIAHGAGKLSLGRPDGTAAAAPGASNIEAVGTLLYSRYLFVFEAAGLVLLVAMIGAIVLTLRTRPGVRRQRISEQLYRPKDDAVTVVKVPTRGGV